MRKFIFSFLCGMFFLPLVVSAIEINSPTGTSSLYGLLNGIKNISLWIIMPIAVTIILIAAFFILRGDISENITKGKRFLTFGLVGLAVTILGAGSSTLLMNVFNIDIPGVTSEPTSISIFKIDDICNSEEIIANNQDIKEICEARANISQCVAK